MTIHVLLTGELHRDPVQRTSASGKTFVTCNIRIESDGTTTWASVITFDQTAQDELLRLKAGDAVAVQGRLKVTTYERGGEVRPSLDVTANVITPLRPKPRERKPRQGKPDGREFDARQVYGRAAPTHQADDMPFDDEIPFG